MNWIVKNHKVFSDWSVFLWDIPNSTLQHIEGNNMMTDWHQQVQHRAGKCFKKRKSNKQDNAKNWDDFFFSDNSKLKNLYCFWCPDSVKHEKQTMLFVSLCCQQTNQYKTVFDMVDRGHCSSQALTEVMQWEPDESLTWGENKSINEAFICCHLCSEQTQSLKYYFDLGWHCGLNYTLLPVIWVKLITQVEDV